MLDGLRIWSSDSVWRKILAELGAVVPEKCGHLDINLDKLVFDTPISGVELKSTLLKYAEHNDIIKKVFGDIIPDLSKTQFQIIVCLYKSKGTSIDELKKMLGFAPNIASHSIDTAIYQMRKMYGCDFIKNENGIYKIGKL